MKIYHAPFAIVIPGNYIELYSSDQSAPHNSTNLYQFEQITNHFIIIKTY